jgi:hypothetical protein
MAEKPRRSPCHRSSERRTYSQTAFFGNALMHNASLQLPLLYRCIILRRQTGRREILNIWPNCFRHGGRFSARRSGQSKRTDSTRWLRASAATLCRRTKTRRCNGGECMHLREWNIYARTGSDFQARHNRSINPPKRTDHRRNTLRILDWQCSTINLPDFTLLRPKTRR